VPPRPPPLSRRHGVHGSSWQVPGLRSRFRVIWRRGSLVSSVLVGGLVSLSAAAASLATFQLAGKSLVAALRVGHDHLLPAVREVWGGQQCPVAGQGLGAVVLALLG
jgi:hypothetical protein